MATNGTKKKRRLGRGLGSLIGDPVPIEAAPPSPDEKAKPPSAPVVGHSSEAALSSPASMPGDLQRIPTNQIEPNPFQPRRAFDEGQLAHLSASIAKAGVMQPVVVRPGTGGGWQLVAGERRWRAAVQAGLEIIPAVVHDVDDQTASQWALVENLQREDLNPMERAEAMLAMVDRWGMTHQEIAEHLGMERSIISNYIRLNELSATLQDALRLGALSNGHAKVLLGIESVTARASLGKQAIIGQWSVRELERQIKTRSMPRSTVSPPSKPAHHLDLEKAIGERLGTRVRIDAGKKKGAGRVVIEFYSLEQFDGLLSHFGVTTTP